MKPCLLATNGSALLNVTSPKVTRHVLYGTASTPSTCRICTLSLDWRCSRSLQLQGGINCMQSVEAQAACQTCLRFSLWMRVSICYKFIMVFPLVTVCTSCAMLSCCRLPLHPPTLLIFSLGQIPCKCAFKLPALTLCNVFLLTEDSQYSASFAMVVKLTACRHHWTRTGLHGRAGSLLWNLIPKSHRRQSQGQCCLSLTLLCKSYLTCAGID